MAGEISKLKIVTAISYTINKFQRIPPSPVTILYILYVGISPAWEEESPGRNLKSLKKVSKKSSDPRAPKSKKSLGESPKSLEKPVFGLFRDFSDSPRDFFQTFGA